MRTAITILIMIAQFFSYMDWVSASTTTDQMISYENWWENPDHWAIHDLLDDMHDRFVSLPEEYESNGGMTVMIPRPMNIWSTDKYTKENILAIENAFPNIDQYILFTSVDLDFDKYIDDDNWGFGDRWLISPDDTETIEANKKVTEHLDLVGPSRHCGYEQVGEYDKEVLNIYLLKNDETMTEMIESIPNSRFVISYANHSLSELNDLLSEILDRAEEFGITNAYIELNRNAVLVHTSRYTVENIHAIREAFPEFDHYIVMDEVGLP